MKLITDKSRKVFVITLLFLFIGQFNIVLARPHNNVNFGDSGIAADSHDHGHGQPGLPINTTQSHQCMGTLCFTPPQNNYTCMGPKCGQTYPDIAIDPDGGFTLPPNWDPHHGISEPVGSIPIPPHYPNWEPIYPEPVNPCLGSRCGGDSLPTPEVSNFREIPQPTALPLPSNYAPEHR